MNRKKKNSELISAYVYATNSEKSEFLNRKVVEHWKWLLRLNYNPWRYLKGTHMWHAGTLFSGRLGSVKVTSDSWILKVFSK